MNFQNDFHSPWVLYFLILPLIYFVLSFIKKVNATRGILFSDVNSLKSLPKSLRQKLFWVLPFLRTLGMCLLIVAAARPRVGQTFEEVNSEGVEIMLTLDISGSMIHLDLLNRDELNEVGRQNPEKFIQSGEINKYSRLGQAKKVIDGFIEKRKSDPLGLVIFSGSAMTRCPLTVDYGILKQLLASVSHETIQTSGTAIGDAMMTAVQRLKDSKAKSRVVVLLTDGANNSGKVHPEKAAAVAKAMGVKIYTIGIGRNDGKTLWMNQNVFTGETFWNEKILPPEERVDEQALQNIASTTGAKYYRATNVKELESIYAEIDQLEKSEIETFSFTKYHEKFYPYLFLGVLILLLELLIAQTWLRSLP